MTERYLLDTCLIIWLAANAQIRGVAADIFDDRREPRCKIFISSMSAWEVAMLISKGRLRTAKSASAWLADIVERAGADIIETSVPILIASSFLPMPVHNDPTDRILIATAREHDLTIVTRDRAILTYGALGHVRVLEC